MGLSAQNARPKVIEALRRSAESRLKARLT